MLFIVHGLRKCIELHWDDEDFAVLKNDMRNAFNLISRQALLSECSLFFPESIHGQVGVWFTALSVAPPRSSHFLIRCGSAAGRSIRPFVLFFGSAQGDCRY